MALQYKNKENATQREKSRSFTVKATTIGDLAAPGVISGASQRPAKMPKREKGPVFCRLLVTFPRALRSGARRRSGASLLQTPEPHSK